VTRRNSLLLVAVAFIAAAGLYWMFILSPKREEAAALSTKITAKQTTLGQAQAELAGYEKARGSYRANYTRVARLGKAVPADDDVRSLMVQLSSAAERTKVDFRMINVDGSEGAPPAGSGGTAAPAAGALMPPPGSSSVGTAGFSTMPFSFEFQGSFSGLGAFFERLDRFVEVKNQGLNVTGRLLLLNSITLHPDTVKGFPLITAEVKANSYLLPPAQGLLAGASADGPTAATASGAPAPAGSTTSPVTTTAAISGAPE
jgi:hypothetical protein